MWFVYSILILLALIIIYDLTQKSHAILRNFPIIGHFRYWLEAIGPELRQYIVTSNNEERPFSRDQRRWIYASSKKENNYFGFGTDNDIETTPNYLIIKHANFPVHDPAPDTPGYDPDYRVPCAKVMGGYRNRKHAFRPNSIINISGMSFGSLSGAAVEALNQGAAITGCLHNSGEGGISHYHQHGGDLIWQIGTGYFGCRNQEGRFDLSQFKDVVAANPIRAIEVKLSQGAKPGVGGFLPAAKITAEVAQIRGIPMGKSCASPASHIEFHSVDSMLDFVEMLADESGLPVGIKSAVGEIEFWRELSQQMAETNRGVDFITLDGGEGGTGAAPMVFADNVALPIKLAISRVYREFVNTNLHDKVVFGASGRLGFPDNSLLALAMGADLIHVAREAMLAIGCIQAQRCHTGHCPTGVATQNKWLIRGLNPTLKATRAANYVTTLRKELLRLSRACGQEHPSLVMLNQFEIMNDQLQSTSATKWFGYQMKWGLPSEADRKAVCEIMSLIKDS